MRILIAGVSARAAAASAARGGFAVTSLDAYGDADAHPAVRALSTMRDFGRRYSAATAARLARACECDAVAYLSNFENNLVAIRTLAGGRTLLGNGPDVVRRVRDPRTLIEAFRSAALPVPRLGNAEDRRSSTPTEWICKPIRSGGGQGVYRWTGGRVPAGHYLQQRIDGTPGSVTFVAARGTATVLGISRQLVGDGAFGVSRYRYCGNVLGPVTSRLRHGAEALAQCAAGVFGLVGLNGIDFVERDGIPYPIELNPRWSASMELVERCSNASLFAAHVEACLHGRLPAMMPPTGAAATVVHGKGVVFARETAIVGDPGRWLDDPDVADVPHAGERIGAGAPICTVFASAMTGDACEAALRRKAAAIYGDVARRRGSAA